MAIHPGDPVYLYGKYAMIVVKDTVTDDTIALWEVSNLEFTEAPKIVSVPTTINRRRTVPSIPVFYDLKIKFDVLAPNSLSKAMLFGQESATSVEAYDITKWQYETVGSSPYTITLDENPSSDLLWVQMHTGTGAQFVNLYEVSSTPVSLTSYTRSGTTLTFDSADANKNVRGAYVYAVGSGTDALRQVWKLSDLPNIVKIVATVYGIGAVSGRKTLSVIEVPRVQITSGRGLKIGADALQDPMKVEGEVLPRNDGTSTSDELVVRIDSLVTDQP